MSATLILVLTFLQAFHGFVAALEGNCRLFSYNMVVKFDLHKDICCDGTVYTRDLDENGNEKTKCCYGRNSRMYDVETHVCCEGEVIAKASEYKGCCQGKIYNKARFTCCDGKVKNKMATPCCGNEPVNQYDGVKCCGGDMYDNIRQTCCNALIWNGVGECCGDILVENPFSDVCCHHNGAARLHMEAYGSSCCGLDTYRPEAQLCCKSVVQDKITDTTECCGNTTFNLTGEVCCQGRVLPRELGKTSCCGGRLYNKDDEVCCKDKIYPRGGRSKCCQDRAYQEEKSLCFNNRVLNESVPHVAGIVQFKRNSSTAYLKTHRFECGGQLMTRDKEKNACCNATAYNTTDHLCCKVSGSSFELVKKFPNHDRCCGRESYDSSKQGCCNPTELQVYNLETEICNKNGVHPRYGTIKMAPQPFLRRKSPKDKLCKIKDSDAVPYNSNTSVCTPKGVVALPEGLEICGNKTFNKDLFICCRGNIFVKYVVDEIQQCCQDPVDKETYLPAIQTCFNGRIVNIPEKDSGICMGEIYNNRTHGCDIAGKIRPNEEIKEKPSVCWYNETYFLYFNETNERCCNGHIIDAAYTCCPEESDCCNPGDIEGYNRETHVCCAGALRRIQQSANLQRLTRSMAARSSQLGANDCRGGNCPSSQHKSFLCCQESLYDVEGELTCDGNLLTGRFRNNTIICRGKLCKNGTDCCGDRSYDNETEICCGGVILEKSDTKKCCGNHVFEPLVEGSLCCESSFYENATGLSCCGGVTYNIKNETCCTTGGKTYVFPSKDGLCCSNGEYYDDTLHTCCDGLVHKYITNGTCCGNDVIRDPTREGCFSERVCYKL